MAFSENFLNELVDIVLKENASDLHLSEGRRPIIRVAGFLIPLMKMEILTKEDMEGLSSLFLTAENRKIFNAEKEANFAYTHKNIGRFRGNIYQELNHTSVALRLVVSKIKTLAELNLPPVLETFTKLNQGFFLVVGPAGQGKSTTLASMMEIINEERLDHVITIEDPIEYVFEQKKALINQREVRSDTPDFHTALRGVFRQDADVIMVGEMRDPETMSTAVTAAETGHLVLSTLHTNTAAQTVDRIIDSFQADQQDQIRVQLSNSLVGIFSQRLVPRISGGLIPAYELLINNNAVSNLIRENRTHEISSVIETGSEDGMIDMNRCLANLVKNGEVTIENAISFSANPHTLERMI